MAETYYVYESRVLYLCFKGCQHKKNTSWTFADAIWFFQNYYTCNQRDTVSIHVIHVTVYADWLCSITAGRPKRWRREQDIWSFLQYNEGNLEKLKPRESLNPQSPTVLASNHMCPAAESCENWSIPPFKHIDILSQADSCELQG
jgi:hypothetical protein